MRILILGGTGAMGKSLVKHLSVDNNYIVVTSRSEHDSTENKIKYIKGNAKDDDFLKSLLYTKWDAIVDFMAYKTKEFSNRCDFLLKNTSQYVFISSARVYAQSDDFITEKSPRLLDVCTDETYLATDEYALAKARQEDLIIKSGCSNYTIVRPSLTYNNQRLQLAIYEKEDWLYRFLNKKKIIFPDSMSKIIQTLSHGNDVAYAIYKLINNPNALGQTVHIAGAEPITWGEVLNVYIEQLNAHTHRNPKVCHIPNADLLSQQLNCNIQLKYARGISRVFDNSKLEDIVGKISFKNFYNGASQCIDEFFADPYSMEQFSKWKSNLQWRKEAYMDRISHDFANVNNFKTPKHALGYLYKRIIF